MNALSTAAEDKVEAVNILSVAVETLASAIQRAKDDAVEVEDIEDELPFDFARAAKDDAMDISAVGKDGKGIAVAAIALFLWRARPYLYTDERTMKAFGSLYLRYRPQAYFWEVCILVRKLALVLIAGLLGADPWAQLGASAIHPELSGAA